jgi:hypothetical protein
LPDRQLGRLDVGTLFHCGDESGALGLRFSFGSLERMPFAFALTIFVDVENDCPNGRVNVL